MGDTKIAAADLAPGATTPRAPLARSARRISNIGPWRPLPAVLAIVVVGVSLLPLGYALTVGLTQVPNGFEVLWADPRFWSALKRTAIVIAVALPIELLLGLALVGVLAGPMPGKRIIIALMALPALVAPVVSGSAWRMMLDNDYGPVNHVLSWFSGGAVMTLWTQSADAALVAIVAADVWQWTPFMVVLMLAGLTHVGRRQLELAALNDAGPWRTFFAVVLPPLRRAIAVAVFIRCLDLLRLFDVIWVLTRGGPEGGTETISVFAFDRLAQGSDPSATAALASAVLLAVSLPAALVFVAMERDR